MDAFCGGFGEKKDATEETQKICDEMKCRVEGQTNEKYVEFKAVKYRQQIVAGTNYLIKVHAGGEKYIHLRLFKAEEEGLTCTEYCSTKPETTPLNLSQLLSLN